MTTFSKVHERRVEKLARAVESAPEGYDQKRITRDCGSPGCLMGHARVVFPDWVPGSKSLNEYLFGDAPPEDSAALDVWWRDAFGLHGCNDAGRDGKKAAAYIRKMGRDLKAALAKEKRA